MTVASDPLFCKRESLGKEIQCAARRFTYLVVGLNINYNTECPLFITEDDAPNAKTVYH